VLPLLMPTTLFILVNAMINSVKLIDHLFILTKGGPSDSVEADPLLHLGKRLRLLRRPRSRGDDGAGAARARRAGRIPVLRLDRRTHYR
jgi:sn-glycerol 3-phosphate transport system permease protein